MFKGRIPNIIYLVHIFLILLLWILFFYLFFLNNITLNLNYPKKYFYLFGTFGFFLWLLGFIFLRKSSLSNIEEKLFKFSREGDLLLFFGFLVLFFVSFIYGNYEFSLGIVLATLIILQTHFPLIEDESFYPEELKNGNMI